jgi:hydrogenase maturation protein HypF
MTHLLSESNTSTLELVLGHVTVQLRVKGIVQGVGFRPFVFRLAKRYELTGWVLNDVEGVLIQVSGDIKTLEAFKNALSSEAPSAALVESVLELSRHEGKAEKDFTIRESVVTPDITTLISPDLPICEDCLQELFDPTNKRYLYPFINCTNCGPRYSIVEALPYDRPLTTMKQFAMCDFCESEYHDPSNRRFHAQPVACPECGPTLRYVKADGEEVARGNTVIELAAKALREGNILAIKGLGGYHLACDAKNEIAIAKLRERKFRKEKPFALMAKNLEVLEPYVFLDSVAKELLKSMPRPIVLIAKGESSLPEALAPDNTELGVMLPYMPLHHLLFEAGSPDLLVMTSANRSSEPIAYKDDGALEHLTGIADAFVMGERPIARRVDDSVVAVFDNRPIIFRRARGYVPSPVIRSEHFTKPILALGAGLKNTITLATGGYAFVSQHLGDLDNYDSFVAFQETVRDLATMYNVDLGHTLVVHDLHPDYASSRYAEELPGKKLAVQHHEAHIASVLAEHDVWDKNVLGFSFDGTGLGTDGTIWGGEVFYGGLKQGFKRVAHLREAYLPGGDAAAKYPEQAAVGFLYGFDESLWQPYLNERIIQATQFLIENKLNIFTTTSMGRLFDTVAALCGFRRKITFEGQAAMWLETQARLVHHDVSNSYGLTFDGEIWDYRSLLESILLDKRKSVEPAMIAYKFHEALARAVVDATRVLSDTYSFDTIALSGGVWQNKLLYHLALQKLRQAGFEVWWNQQAPPGDGGISLGQAALAAKEVW